MEEDYGGNLEIEFERTNVGFIPYSNHCNLNQKARIGNDSGFSVSAL